MMSGFGRGESATSNLVGAGSASDPQQPLRRDPTLGLADSVGDHIGHRIVIVGPLNPRWRRPAGLELLHDPFDGLVAGAAQFGAPRYDPTC
jgi:hypothetical protein